MPGVIFEAFAFLLNAEKGGHIMYCPAVFPSVQPNTEVLRLPAWVIYYFCWQECVCTCIPLLAASLRTACLEGGEQVPTENSIVARA